MSSEEIERFIEEVYGVWEGPGVYSVEYGPGSVIQPFYSFKELSDLSFFIYLTGKAVDRVGVELVSLFDGLSKETTVCA